MKNLLRNLFILIFLAASFIFSCQNPEEDTIEQTQIIWDEWGVPHIFAQNNEELFYSFGWAQMQSHCNTLLKLFGQARGRGAEYWGEKNLTNDIMIHTMGFDELASDWYQSQSAEFKPYFDAFVRGINDYATSNSNGIEEQYQMVLPIRGEDIMALAIFDIYGRFIAGNELGRSQSWGEELGSNAWAIGPSKSASGNAMLVTNPHLPWNDEFLFYEAHFNAPGVNIYGTSLIGLPSLAIAFNEHLGWTHTVNTIDAADLYELTLTEGGYLLDGEVKAFEASKKNAKNKKQKKGFWSKKLMCFAQFMDLY